MMFGERMRILRNARGLTQAECAKSVGVSDTQYQNYESTQHNNYPPVSRLIMIAEFFDCPLIYLLGEESAISEDDQRLLSIFHTLTPEQQKTMLTFGETLKKMP